MNTVTTGRAPWTLRLLFLASGAWVAAVAPFIVVILRSRGLDTVTIGLLSALSALAAAVMVPAWGHLADVLVGRAYAFRLGLGLAIGSSLVVMLPVPLPVFAFTMALFSVLPILFLSLGDALAVNALSAPERQYGPLRALASLSFAVGVIVAGFLYDAAGYDAVPFVALVWSVSLLVLLRWVPDRTRDPRIRAIAGREGGDLAAGRFGSISRVLSVQPRFLAVLAVLTLAYTGLQGSMVFLPIRIVELGGKPSDVALTYGIASFAEIPGLMLVGWAGRRIGIRWLVVLTLAAYGLCILSWGVLATPLAINATRVVTGDRVRRPGRRARADRGAPVAGAAPGDRSDHGSGRHGGAGERLRRADRRHRLRRSRSRGVLRVRRAPGGGRRARRMAGPRWRGWRPGSSRRATDRADARLTAMRQVIGRRVVEVDVG